MRQITQTEKVVAVRAVQKEMDKNSKLFFLFTAAQVEEVLSGIVTRPVPFAPSFLSGVALWRGHLLPVIDLEDRFAFSGKKKNMGKSRFLIVRTGAVECPDDGKIFRCVLQLSENIHSIDAPDSSTVISSECIGVKSSLVRGTYQWHDDIYIVPDLISILQNQQTIDN